MFGGMFEMCKYNGKSLYVVRSRRMNFHYVRRFCKRSIFTRPCIRSEQLFHYSVLPLFSLVSWTLDITRAAYYSHPTAPFRSTIPKPPFSLPSIVSPSLCRRRRVAVSQIPLRRNIFCGKKDSRRA